MKITKNADVKADMAVPEEVVDVEIGEIGGVSQYQCAIDNIMNAIDCLGELAQSDDQIARDAIANLSVVLLDLKG